MLKRTESESLGEVAGAIVGWDTAFTGALTLAWLLSESTNRASPRATARGREREIQAPVSLPGFGRMRDSGRERSPRWWTGSIRRLKQFTALFPIVIGALQALGSMVTVCLHSRTSVAARLVF
jgi:hypothetical protein